MVGHFVSTSWVLLLAIALLGCADARGIAASHEKSVKAKLAELKAVCEAFEKDRKLPVEPGKLPEPLAVMTVGEGREKDHNAMLMDGDFCPDLKMRRDDKAKGFKYQTLNVGYHHPVAHMADIYWRNRKFQFEQYEKSKGAMKDDIAAVEQLKYVVFWHVDEFVIPIIDEEKESFEGGTFKGKLIAYRLSDGARLSSVQLEAANSEHVTIDHGSRTHEFTERNYDSIQRRNVDRRRTQTFSLGSFGEAARRDLMWDLTKTVTTAAEKAMPFRTVR